MLSVPSARNDVNLQLELPFDEPKRGHDAIPADGTPFTRDNDPRHHPYDEFADHDLLLEAEDRVEIAAMSLAHGLVWGDMPLDVSALVALRHLELALLAFDRVLPSGRPPRGYA